jgi:hypothetical protein
VARKGWQVSFESSEALRDQERHQCDTSGSAEEGSLCARGEWCSAVTIQVAEDGSRKRVAARTPRVFCGPCETRIAACLDELPAAYGRMAAEIGETPRHGKPVRVPFGPRLVVRTDLDALMRLTTRTLRGWEARTRAVPPAWTPPADVPLDSGESVGKSVEAIARRLGAMLALQEGWMTRSFDLRPGRRNEAAALLRELEEMEAVHGDREIMRIGVDFISLQVPVGGKEAGLEVLHLHYRARSVLGETTAPPEAFDGVPCRQCGDIALERAEPPSDPDTEAKHSRCASCGHAMDERTFTGWSKWYGGWAEGAGLPACKRCQRGRHGECAWPACPCASAGHAAAAA